MIHGEIDKNILPIADTDDLMFDPSDLPESLPILPVRNNIIFPNIIMPVQVGREKSLKIINSANKQNSYFIAGLQIDPEIENPKFEDLHKWGTICKVIKIFPMPDGTISALLQGLMRVQIVEKVKSTPYYYASYLKLEDNFPNDNDSEFEALINSIKELGAKAVKLNSNTPDEVAMAIESLSSPAFIISFVANQIDLDQDQKLAILSLDDVKQRGLALLEYLSTEIQKLELQGDIQNKVRKELDKQQRDYYLNQQIKTIQNELGSDPLTQEIERLEQLAKGKDWPEHAQKAFEKELNRLKATNNQSPEYTISLTYLQTLVDLPWNYITSDDFDMKHAQKILEKEHYGLEKVKERILEYLAVLKIKGDLKSPILCLYGPPGVGKTSLGRSIANALNRKYVRMSLGGLSDEAEIRGHRKTYIGAMCGRIIQNIKKCQSSNPVFILDEIDKLGKDFRGDPASALLEVLDPEQNFEFHDNYLDLDYDLSKVMFIATANSINSIPSALLDRMELIEVAGYVSEEKVEIAKRHILPKTLENHGISKENLKIKDDNLKFIIDNYTRESGVRELAQVLASITRKTVSKIAFEQEYNINLSQKDISEMLGNPKYTHDEYQNLNIPGVVTGLAWTSAGGEILFVESSLSRGTGTLTLTGNLGNVMKESAEIALEYVRANAKELRIKHEIFKAFNVHLHVPEGAIPKDGPSAGITMFTCFASLFTRRPVKANIAMTGELTLSGRVLPVGGIKEKILAAKRAGIKTIFLSKENQRDILEINPIYLKGLEFVYVTRAMELIEQVLEPKNKE